ncbi:MAG: hypothetical protein JO061_21140, partial [Acidobacteriaceae bacterium]|nr:hypothetical protein [Acidobacteriaceae bacterium]
MRKWFIPEVVQSSALDCGPAALKSYLEGFNIPVSYGRLREACQTGLDGTCIDTVETVANQLGVASEQIMLPIDHLFLPESKSLPAVLVVQLSDGLTHFVVVWRRHGSLLQIMDPAVGRRWVPVRRFLREIYRHRMPVPAEAWREFAASDEFQAALQRRLRNLKIPRARAAELSKAALEAETWNELATLDAAVRLLDGLLTARAIRTQRECMRILDEFRRNPELIPPHYWSVVPTEPDQDGGALLLMTGAVLVRATHTDAAVSSDQPVCDEVRAAANEKPLRPAIELARYLWQTGPASVAFVALGVILSCAGVLVEALLFRNFLDLESDLHMAGRRIAATGIVVLFSTVLLLLDISVFAETMRMARYFETRLRVAFLRKIPNLSDRYFTSRLTSDMAARSHATHRFRHLPDQLCQFVVAALKLVFTAAAVIWLEPGAWIPVALIVLAALAIPAFAQSGLAERELRVQNHAGALTRFYLDGMLGL